MAETVRTIAQITFTPFDVQAIGALALEGATAALQATQNLVQARLQVVIGTQYYSLAELHKLGHPYNKVNRGSGLAIPKDYINLQSGDFYRGVYTFIGRGTSSTSVTLRLMSTDDKTFWLGRGTPRMIPRYWVREVMLGIEEEFVSNLATAVAKSLRVEVVKR